MQKNANSLSKIVFTCLIINTLPVHVPIYGEMPKGQELAALKQEINRDVSSIKKTVSRLKKLKLIIPGLIIGAGVIATIVVVATTLLLVWGIKKGLKIRRQTKKDNITNQMKRFSSKKLPLEERYQQLLEYRKLRKKASTLAPKYTRAQEALTKLQKSFWENEKAKAFQELKDLAHQFKISPKLNYLITDYDAKLHDYPEKIQRKLNSSISNLFGEIKNSYRHLLFPVSQKIFDEDYKKAHEQIVMFFGAYIRTKEPYSIKSTIGGWVSHLKETTRYSLASDSEFLLLEPINKIKKQIKSLQTTLKIKQLDDKIINTAKNVLEGIESKQLVLGEELDALPDYSKYITPKSTFWITILTAINTLIGTGIVTGLSFVGLSVAVDAANKKAKRLEAIKKEYPGILTLQQERALAEFKKLYGDPRMQGIIKNIHLQVALAKIVDETVKRYPALVEALGGPKKASKAFKKYAKRKWDETKLQRALDVAGKLMKIKIRIEFGIKRSRLRSQRKKLVSQVEKAQLDVTQLKKALNSAAQSYIKQADVVLEDLKNQLIEAIEAEKIRLQETAGPTIAL